MSFIDPLLIACIVMVMVYYFVITDKMNQAVVALLGAVLVIFLGVVTQDEAIDAIDFNTLFLLIGMMIIVLTMKRSGVFQFLAIWAARVSRGNPRVLFILLSLITAGLSGLLDNVTTVMLIVPVVLLITEQLKLKAWPFLLAQAFFSNVGGTATLIGDPPNIIIGSAVGFSFMDFVVNAGPIVVVCLIIYVAIFDFIWGRHMTTSLRARAHLLRYDPVAALEDKPLLYKSLFVLALTIGSFIFGHMYFHIPTGTSALAGAVMLLLLDSIGITKDERNKRVQRAFEHLEWETIFFFLGLFVVVAALEKVGVLNFFAQQMITFTQGDFNTMAMVILWGSGILSAFINNIPFVATMIPIIKDMAGQFGGADAIEPLWWSLVLGACLGGNGSLIGASANVICAAYASRANQPISFMKFTLAGFPLMLISIALSTIYIYWRYL
jgi:Na+/H+ antiporter NhaD/arsenite permease-like protein